jgi:hypothetical protein
MSSKKVPLWLVFRNADPSVPDPIYVIFKSGDDLRQDILTLQLLRVMDKMWLSCGLDLRLKPYRCIATGVTAAGEGVGMIEVVTKSDTTSGIQLVLAEPAGAHGADPLFVAQKFGGGAIGALMLDPLLKYIEKFNEGSDKLATAVDNFCRSCAGYCVATYVLGIGDRHNGNIMVTQVCASSSTRHRVAHRSAGTGWAPVPHRLRALLGKFQEEVWHQQRARALRVHAGDGVRHGREELPIGMVAAAARSRSSPNLAACKDPRFAAFKDNAVKAFNVLRKMASLLENYFILVRALRSPAAV